MAEVKAGAFDGGFHTAAHSVADDSLAYVLPAKAMVMAVVDLLADHAREARVILAEFKPRMPKAAYLSYLRSFG